MDENWSESALYEIIIFYTRSIQFLCFNHHHKTRWVLRWFIRTKLKGEKNNNESCYIVLPLLLKMNLCVPRNCCWFKLSTTKKKLSVENVIETWRNFARAFKTWHLRIFLEKINWIILCMQNYVMRYTQKRTRIFIFPQLSCELCLQLRCRVCINASGRMGQGLSWFIEWWKKCLMHF